MANLTPAQMSKSGATLVAVATESGGDQVVFAGREVLVTFRNGHTSPITVTCTPTATTMETIAGPTTPPTRSQAIAAGASWSILFDATNVSPYLNASGRIPFTYTGHNVALVVTAQVN